MAARDWVLLLALALLWGGSFPFTEVALRDLEPFTIVMARVGLAAPALWLLVYATGGRMPRDLALWRQFLIMGALNNLIPFSLITLGQTQIDSGMAATLNSTTPLSALVLAHVLTQDERATPNKVAGLLIGIVGVAVLVGPALAGGLDLQGLGHLAVIGATVAYACAAIFGRRFKGQPPMVVAAGMVTCSTILVAPLSLALEQPWTAAPSGSTWLALLAIALPGTALAYILYFRILKTAGATNLMLVTLLIPPFALTIGVVFLGEPATPKLLAGMALVLVALLVVDGRALAPLRRGLTKDPA